MRALRQNDSESLILKVYILNRINEAKKALLSIVADYRRIGELT